MKLSDNVYLVLAFSVVGAVVAGAVSYLDMPHTFVGIEGALKAAGWMSFFLAALSFSGFLFGIIKYKYFSEEIFSVAIASLILAGAIFYVPSFPKNEAKQRACTAVGAEWKYLGDQEGYGCRKEYQSCGPDENKPGFTICEKKFKRVQPEAN